jgi:hypothetical protein
MTTKQVKISEIPKCGYQIASAKPLCLSAPQ